MSQAQISTTTWLPPQTQLLQALDTSPQVTFCEVGQANTSWSPRAEAAHGSQIGSRRCAPHVEVKPIPGAWVRALSWQLHEVHQHIKGLQFVLARLSRESTLRLSADTTLQFFPKASTPETPSLEYVPRVQWCERCKLFSYLIYQQLSWFCFT